jgi:hypothetical protein
MSRVFTGIASIDGTTPVAADSDAESSGTEDRNIKPNVNALERMVKSQQRTNKRLEDDPKAITGISQTFVSKRLRAISLINKIAAKYDLPVVAFPLLESGAFRPQESLKQAATYLATFNGKESSTVLQTWSTISDKLADAEMSVVAQHSGSFLCLPDKTIPSLDAFGKPEGESASAPSAVSGRKRKREASGGAGSTNVFQRALLGLPGLVAKFTKPAVAPGVSPVTTVAAEPSQVVVKSGHRVVTITTSSPRPAVEALRGLAAAGSGDKRTHFKAALTAASPGTGTKETDEDSGNAAPISVKRARQASASPSRAPIVTKRSAEPTVTPSSGRIVKIVR